MLVSPDILCGVVERMHEWEEATPRAERNRAILEFSEAGWSNADIAAEFLLSPGTVYRIVREGYDEHMKRCELFEFRALMKELSAAIYQHDMNIAKARSAVEWRHTRDGTTSRRFEREQAEMRRRYERIGTCRWLPDSYIDPSGMILSPSPVTDEAICRIIG